MWDDIWQNVAEKRCRVGFLKDKMRCHLDGTQMVQCCVCVALAERHRQTWHTHSGLFNLITDLHSRVATLTYNNLENKTQQGCSVLVKLSCRQNDKLAWCLTHLLWAKCWHTIHYQCFYIQIHLYPFCLIQETLTHYIVFWKWKKGE